MQQCHNCNRSHGGGGIDPLSPEMPIKTDNVKCLIACLAEAVTEFEENSPEICVSLPGGGSNKCSTADAVPGDGNESPYTDMDKRNSNIRILVTFSGDPKHLVEYIVARGLNYEDPLLVDNSVDHNKCATSSFPSQQTAASDKDMPVDEFAANAGDDDDDDDDADNVDTPSGDIRLSSSGGRGCSGWWPLNDKRDKCMLDSGSSYPIEPNKDDIDHYDDGSLNNWSWWCDNANKLQWITTPPKPRRGGHCSGYGVHEGKMKELGRQLRMENLEEHCSKLFDECIWHQDAYFAVINPKYCLLVLSSLYNESISIRGGEPHGML